MCIEDLGCRLYLYQNIRSNRGKVVASPTAASNVWLKQKQDGVLKGQQQHAGQEGFSPGFTVGTRGVSGYNVFCAWGLGFEVLH